MINQLEIKDSVKETIEVLKYFDAEFVSKIPKNMLKMLNEVANESNIIVNIDKSKKLNEQEISETCKDLIALIYYNYIADEEQKKEILKIWNQNEKLYQEKLSEKYDIDKIIGKRDKSNYKLENTNLPIVIQKENVFKKIKRFLTKLFNKNN